MTTLYTSFFASLRLRVNQKTLLQQAQGKR
jgi:hypothetical protein